ncbi:hypothetical protein GGS20DRAFT_563303 [Poronia punctata]|nr:hypothetical protein GGS20DRAFT_563303 [Poronia punctata]
MFTLSLRLLWLWLLPATSLTRRYPWRRRGAGEPERDRGLRKVRQRRDKETTHNSATTPNARATTHNTRHTDEIQR